nr:aminoacyl-tRNA hydrolase [Maliibacterium massiliense]
MPFWEKFKRQGRAPRDQVMIVGLGNPGLQYEKTRHNAGFIAVDALASRYGIAFKMHKARALVGQGQIEGRRVMLVKPQTFMNASGEAVGALVRYYRFGPAQLVVLYDDIDLPAGALRVRPSGGAGTHNGMRSVLAHVGDEHFARIRIGVGAPPRGYDLADYVLGKAPEEMLQACGRAAEAAKVWACEGCEAAMRAFNGKPKPPEQAQ